MEKINFNAGNEKRFYDFISNLDERKTALISHTDLDGISSARIVNEVIQADLIKFVGYEDLNKTLLEALKRNKIKRAIFTDLSITDINFIKELEKFCDVLVIDHHLFSLDYNTEKTIFLNSQGYCAAYICYYLFSKIQNLEKFDWLVSCACVADWQYFKNQEWMNAVFKKYGDVFTADSFKIKKSKIFWDLQLKLSYALIYFYDNPKEVYDSIGNKIGEIGDLEKCASEVQKEIDQAVENFEKEKKEIKGGYFWEFKPNLHVGSIVTTIVSEKCPDKTVIIARVSDETYNLSARRQDGKEDMNVLLKKLILGFENASGGGHFRAAGAHILLKDREEFKKRVLEMK